MNQAIIRLTPTAVAELGTLTARVLSGLPLATALRVKLPGHDAPATFQVAGLTARRDSADGPTVAADGPTFEVDEVAAIAEAVEHGRAGARDVAAWCAQKAIEPTFRVTHEVAFSGVAVLSAPRWSLDAVLRELGAVIMEAAIVDDTALALPIAA